MEGFDTPHEIAIVQKGDMLYDDESLEEVKAILQKNRIKLEGMQKVRGIILNGEEKDSKFFTISNSDYNKLAESLGKESLEVKPDELAFNYDINRYRSLKKTEEDKVQLNIGGDIYKFKLVKEVQGGVTAVRKLGY